ncbi:MAG: hypothetical protein LBB48_06205, partial [Treponema sp.]|nr:hypothetical protein [Treponema sp.]
MSKDSTALSLDNDTPSLDNKALSLDNGAPSLDNKALSLDIGPLSSGIGAPSLDNGALSLDAMVSTGGNALDINRNARNRVAKEVKNMSQRTDWLPGTRTGRLAMAKEWKAVVAINAGAWNIPAAVAEKLAALAGGAETALDAAKNETTR